MKELFVDIEGTKTQFFRIGSGDTKVIILHGWAQDIDITESFKPLIDSLSHYNFLEKFEIILPHFPGFGQSDIPKNGWNTTDYAIWLEKFLKIINPPTAPNKIQLENKIKSKKDIIFFSHSFGGRVLVRFLLRNPDSCEKAIFSASAGIKWPLSLRQRLSIFLSQKLSRAKKALPQKIQKIILNKLLGARDWGAVRPELKPTLKKVLAEDDFRNKLSKIKTNVLLLWGAKDKITPLRSGKVFENQLPNVQLKIFEDGKHGIHKTHIKEMAKEINNFLK